jgi:hypothetical protein
VNSVRLSDATLERIATTLSDFYFVHYEEPAVNSRASLTGNMLAFVFDGGLSVADEWLLRSGRAERLREFRQNFFEVVAGELIELVGGLAGMAVTYSFYGFDPTTRTTHTIFVLDARERYGADERQAVVNWSEQVRRNARRLWRERRAAREAGQSPE